MDEWQREIFRLYLWLFFKAAFVASVTVLFCVWVLHSAIVPRALGEFLFVVASCALLLWFFSFHQGFSQKMKDMDRKHRPWKYHD